MVGLDDGPAIRDLEAKYGSAKRKGAHQGWSWRSKHTRGGSRKLDVEWGKRKAAYRMIDCVGEAEALQILRTMWGEVPNRAKMSNAAVMRAILAQLTSEEEGFEERSEAVKTAKRRRRPESDAAADPLPSPPESPTSIPAVPVSIMCSLALQCLGDLSLSLEGVRSALRWATPSSLVSTVGGDLLSVGAAADGATELPGPKLLAGWLLHYVQRSVMFDVVKLLAVCSVLCLTRLGLHGIARWVAARHQVLAALVGATLALLYVPFMARGSAVWAVTPVALSLVAVRLLMRGWAKSAEFVSSVATVLIVAPMTELPLSYLSEQLARWIFYKLILSFVINMKAVWLPVGQWEVRVVCGQSSMLCTTRKG